MEGFIRGGTGLVPLANILTPQLSGFSTRAMQEAAARKYEAENPAAIVDRPWETPAEKEARAANRRIDEVARPTSGMDPERAARELRRLNHQLSGLSPDHPEYQKLFTNITREINAREFDCGLEQTKFTLGVQPVKAEEAVSPEAKAKFDAYNALTNKSKKKKALETAMHVETLRLIRATEPDADLALAATLRLEQLTA